jgi:dihydrofolate reductase
MIYARSINNIIGRRDGSIPFHSKVDMKRFRDLTRGCALIVGRKTYMTLPASMKRDDRIIYVLSRTGSPDDVLRMALSSGKDVFIIGGAEVYKLYEDVATMVYETIFEDPVEEMDGDVLYRYDPGDRDFVATVTRADNGVLFRDYMVHE